MRPDPKIAKRHTD
jgi:hypothetical protein